MTCRGSAPPRLHQSTPRQTNTKNASVKSESAQQAQLQDHSSSHAPLPVEPQPPKALLVRGSVFSQTNSSIVFFFFFLAGGRDAVEAQEKEDSERKKMWAGSGSTRQKTSHEHGRGCGRSAFPMWKQMSVTGNPEGKI